MLSNTNGYDQHKCDRTLSLSSFKSKDVFVNNKNEKENISMSDLLLQTMLNDLENINAMYRTTWNPWLLSQYMQVNFSHFSSCCLVIHYIYALRRRVSWEHFKDVSFLNCQGSLMFLVSFHLTSLKNSTNVTILYSPDALNATLCIYFFWVLSKMLHSL